MAEQKGFVPLNDSRVLEFLILLGEWSPNVAAKKAGITGLERKYLIRVPEIKEKIEEKKRKHRYFSFYQRQVDKSHPVDPAIDFKDFPKKSHKNKGKNIIQTGKNPVEVAKQKDLVKRKKLYAEYAKAPQLLPRLPAGNLTVTQLWGLPRWKNEKV